MKYFGKLALMAIAYCILFPTSAITQSNIWGTAPDSNLTHTQAPVRILPSTGNPNDPTYFSLDWMRTLTLDSSHQISNYNFGFGKASIGYYSLFFNSFPGKKYGFKSDIYTSSNDPQYAFHSTTAGCSNCYAGFFDGNVYEQRTVIGTDLTVGQDANIGSELAIGIPQTRPSEKMTLYNGNFGLGNTNRGYLFFHTWQDANQANRLEIVPRMGNTHYFSRKLALDEDGSMIKWVDASATHALVIRNAAWADSNGVYGEEVFRIDGSGKAWGREVEIRLPGTFPDYVFREGYPLMPFDQLRAFIRTNNHLPNIPSEAEVRKAGNSIALGEMNLKLLEKVEELTLYILELERRIKELEK